MSWPRNPFRRRRRWRVCDKHAALDAALLAESAAIGAAIVKALRAYQVPELPATGGIVRSPTIARIGEAGCEYIVPLSRGDD